MLRLSPFFILPFSVLLYTLIVLGKTPQFSAALAIFISMALLGVDRKWKFSLKALFEKFIQACITASRQIATIASVIICAGIIIGVLNITGVGVKITSAILFLSGGEIWLALVLTALACLILGMEVPTTAAYIICVSVAGPILEDFGLAPLQAHLFIFWFALLSTITPPVCGTVFIASGMAQTPWFEVAMKAMKLGVGLYIIPMAFIVNDQLIYPQLNFLGSLVAFLKIAIGLLLISNAIVGSLKRVWLRFVLAVLGLFVIFIPF